MLYNLSPSSKEKKKYKTQKGMCILEETASREARARQFDLSEE